MRVSLLTVSLFSGLMGAGLFASAGGAVEDSSRFTLGTLFRWPGESPRGSASAYDPYFAPPLPPDEAQTRVGLSAETVARLLTARGFSDISAFKRKGGIFLCEATGPRRERVRLVINAGSGEISGVEVIGFEDQRY